jgi:adducin
VLEGVTWEEAQRIKEGQPLNGIDNVRVTAASRGIIQREHQRDALFYKKYTLTNPFDSITDADLDKYRRDVQKKSKKGGGYGREAESEPEFLSDRHQVAPPQGARSATPPAKPARMSPVQDYTTSTNQSYSKSYSLGTDIDEPEQKAVVKPVLTAQPQPKAEPTQQQREPTTVILSPPVAVQPAKDRGDFPQRSQSARYPAEKRPDLSDRGVLLDSPPAHASTLDRSSKENSPSRDSTLTKEKKKKKGLRFPSFSKKKEKQ